MEKSYGLFVIILSIVFCFLLSNILLLVVLSSTSKVNQSKIIPLSNFTLSEFLITNILPWNLGINLMKSFLENFPLVPIFIHSDMFWNHYQNVFIQLVQYIMFLLVIPHNTLTTVLWVFINNTLIVGDYVWTRCSNIFLIIGRNFNKKPHFRFYLIICHTNHCGFIVSCCHLRS